MNVHLGSLTGGGEQRPRVGTWVKIPSTVTLEIVARTPFDFIVVDLEHSVIGLDWLQTACAIAQGHETSVLVRMPDASGRDVQRVLDAGVDGVVVPQIRSADEAANVVAAATFPPGGRRGVGLTSRAGAWGTQHVRTYMDTGNQQMTRCIQFETPESFSVMDEILRLPGLNAVLLGSADLSVAMGVTPSDPMVRTLAERLVGAARDRGITCGTAVRGPGDVENACALGFQFVVVGNDLTTCAAALNQLAVDAVTGLQR